MLPKNEDEKRANRKRPDTEANSILNQAIKNFYQLGFQDDEMGEIVDLVAEYLEYFGEDEL